MPAKGKDQKSAKGKKKEEDFSNLEDTPERTIVTFSVIIEAKPTPLHAESTTAYDTQFNVQFIGEEEPECTNAVSSWETPNVWTKEYQRIVDKEWLINFSETSCFQIGVEEKSCAFTFSPAEGEEKAAADKKKPAKKSGKKPTSARKSDRPSSRATTDGSAGLERPAELDAEEFSPGTNIEVNLASFMIDTKPVSLVYKRSDPRRLPTPPSLSSLKISVTVNKFILSQELLSELKPMELTVQRAHNLASKPFDYSKMGKYYDPVFVTYDFFNQIQGQGAPAEPPGTADKTSRSNKSGKSGRGKTPEAEPVELDPIAAVQAAAAAAAKKAEDAEKDPGAIADGDGEDSFKGPSADALPQIIAPPISTITTGPRPHSDAIEWNHKKIFLLGLLDLKAFAAFAQSNDLVFNVRDRDVSEEGKRRARDEKWEGKAVAKMVCITEGNNDQSEAASPEPPASEDASTTPRGGSKSGKRSASKTPTSKSGRGSRAEDEEARQKEAAKLKAEADKEEADSYKRNMYGVARVSMLDIFRGAKSWTSLAPICPVYQPRGSQLLAFQVNTNPYEEDCYLSLQFRLAQTLKMTLPNDIAHKYNRAFFLFPYKDSEMHQKITHAIQDANVRAMHMEDAPSHDLSTILLSPEQRKILTNHDILTSFTVIDKNLRMFVVEGLAMSEKGATAMKLLKEAVPRRSENTPTYRVLFDERITFNVRMYMHFDLSPKTIKLISPLPSIVKNEHLYLNHNIPPPSFTCLQQLMQLSQTSSMKHAKMINTFPQVVHLISMEKRYGDFVSDEDLEGYNPNRVRQSRSARRKRAQQVNFQASQTVKVKKKEEKASGRQRPSSSKAAVDHLNPEYMIAREDHAIRREGIKWMRENRKLAIANQLLPTVKGYQHVPNLYEQLSEDYTWELDHYRMDKEEREAKERKEKAQKHRGLEKGFRVIDVSDMVEKRKHRLFPDKARVEELATRWVPPSSLNTFKMEKFDQEFITRARLGGEFGMPGNSDWNKSVFHQTEDQLAEERAAIRKAVKEDFEAKLVVSDPVFHIHRTRKNPTVLDKMGPILHGGPQKKAYMYRQRMKVSKRRVGPPLDMGTSIFSAEPYGQKGITAVGRADTTFDSTLHGKDFRPTNADPAGPREWRPKIKPLSDGEITRMRTLRIPKPSSPLVPSL
mmetsp:Transcript_8931/g.17057  ORF Transcript_8931/g.17057 Transcript_8931/m.17057 type:complete len:1162 (+) Transcript_8931:45-3530(+)|eukprot:CAMPEP_0175150044 /NCGR_PEP_ID=MMETSP0087-20121206/17621_1 /TAXON_ID=136419 /ORGANISM="Unknown Unknown, Strain D1" /LENGTH=1161 /DNA_ID=CAMNT_0016435885 /DNA_START=32 /DNA_END=3517 /DNA_ORIENTATION=-